MSYDVMANSGDEIMIATVDRIRRRPLLAAIAEKKQQLDQLTDRVERAKASLLAETRLHDELQRRREKRGLRRLDDWIRVQTDADASFLQKLQDMIDRCRPKIHQVDTLLEKLANQNKTLLETNALEEERCRLESQWQQRTKRKTRSAVESSPPN